MRLLSHRPSPRLSHFVDVLWLMEGPAPAHGRERVLPTATTELVIDLREESGLDAPVLSGAHSESFVIETAPQTAVIGVHFKPGGAFPFMKIPAGELCNASVGLDALWGSRAGELRERVLAAPTPRARLEALEGGLLAQAPRPLERHPAVEYALRAFGRESECPSVSAVVERTGWSHRRFVELFRDQVGLTPKRFCRVMRFQQALRAVHEGEEVDWADLAAGCGYYDQAHLIHDFRAFSGLAPTDYQRMRSEHRNHVPLAR
jgi:AraC-like DNA-binding protein